MSENKHTPEPWSYGEDNDGWYVARGNEQIGYCLTEDDARRIVACVNACKGVPSVELEMDNAMFIDALNERRTLRTKADAMAETINAIAGLCTYQHESKEDFIGRVRAVLGDDPDLRLSSVRKERDELLEALEKIAKKCNLDMHGDDGSLGGYAYGIWNTANTAIARAKGGAV